MTVLYSGFHLHNPDYDHIYRPSGLPHYLFLLVLSPMIFVFEDGRKTLAPKGSCILYTPGTYQNYRGKEDFFNSFIEFQTDEVIEEKYQIPENQLFQPQHYEQINELIQKINQEYLLPHIHTEDLVNAYLTQLFVSIERTLLAISMPKKDEQYQAFQTIRLNMLTNCEKAWHVQDLSHELSLGKSQFYKRYQQFFHTTPKEDLLQARLQKFLFLRSNEALTIRQAAFRAGFQSINHFNRLFHKRFGCSPTEYTQRKNDRH